MTLTHASLNLPVETRPSPRLDELRIVYATPRYFPMTGGVESHVYQVAARLAQWGAQVTVLTTDPTGALPDEEVIEGVCVRRVPAYPRNLDFYYAPDIYRRVLQGSWDILHVQSYHTFVPFFAIQAARSARMPFVLTFHGGGHTNALRHALRPLQRAVLRPFLAQASRLVALTNFEIEEYGAELGLPRERFALIPNGSNLIAPRPGSPGTDGGPVDRKSPLILSIGRLEKYKGHHRAIAALPHLLAQLPEARLRIVGGGPYEASLRRLAQQLGVAERVEIRAVPPDQRGEMAELICRASLVVLLSDFETHPIAALEALSLKRPVLVANNSGMKELAERGWASAIPTNCSPAVTAAAMLEQIRCPRIPEHLQLATWDDCARQLAGLYREVLGC